MKKFIDDYFFTLIFLTMFVLFSGNITNFYNENIIMYILFSLVVIGNILIVEYTLNKKFDLKEKAVKMNYSFVPINVVAFILMLVFVF